jgi:glycyl-tRNA synthetase beta chain
MADLLCEVVSEPMPPGLQGWVWRQMWEGLRSGLKERSGYDMGEPCEGEDNLVTPYRVVLMVRDLPMILPPRELERRGPREDAPEVAFEGFLRSVGGDREGCVVEETAKGRFWFYRKREEGLEMAEVLRGLIVDVILGLRWPTVMRFADEGALWVRPLQRVVGVLNGEVLGGGLDCEDRAWRAQRDDVEGYFPYESTTWEDMLCLGCGDRPREVEVRDLCDYEAMGLTLRREDREKEIRRLCGEEEVGGWSVKGSYLGERFAVLRCEVEGGVDLPTDVVSTVLLEHMKVFVSGCEGGVVKFLALLERRSDGCQDYERIRRGYEKVAVARLQDANFFWLEDGRVPLESRIVFLEDRIWHRKLGSMGAKARRLEALTGCIVEKMGGGLDEVERGCRAGLLSKSDLASRFVGEYPSLQGLVGRYYGQREGEDERVSEAIGCQYKVAEEVVEVGMVSRGLYLAERLDTLVGMWHVGEQPTGSRDPFALRRAALQVVKVLWFWEVDLSLETLLESAMERGEWRREGLGEELLLYFRVRLEEVLSERYGKPFVEASLGRKLGSLCVKEVVGTCEALKHLDERDHLELLSDMWHRAGGLIEVEEVGGDYDEGLSDCEEERNLWKSWMGLEKKGMGRNCEGIIAYAEEILVVKKDFDEFCDNVRVNDPDERTKSENRMRLLWRVREGLDEIFAGDSLVRMYSQRKR